MLEKIRVVINSIGINRFVQVGAPLPRILIGFVEKLFQKRIFLNPLLSIKYPPLKKAVIHVIAMVMSSQDIKAVRTVIENLQISGGGLIIMPKFPPDFQGQKFGLL